MSLYECYLLEKVLQWSGTHGMQGRSKPFLRPRPDPFSAPRHNLKEVFALMTPFCLINRGTIFLHVNKNILSAHLIIAAKQGPFQHPSS